MITLIWAQSLNEQISYQNHLPWAIKEEMQHFVTATLHKPVLMGRKTWDSLKTKPLKNRENIVLTSNQNLVFSSSVTVIHTLDTIINKYQNSEDELMVIGGAKVFAQTMQFAQKLIVSYLFKTYLGNLRAPRIDLTQWKVIKKEEHQAFVVLTYQRITC